MPHLFSNMSFKYVSWLTVLWVKIFGRKYVAIDPGSKEGDHGFEITTYTHNGMVYIVDCKILEKIEQGK